MPTAFALYTAFWIVACLSAVAVAVVQRRRIELFDGAYWRFLARPWRLTTFFVAAGSLIVVAPYTGDPTWDYVDATFMSVLACATGITPSRGFRISSRHRSCTCQRDCSGASTIGRVGASPFRSWSPSGWWRRVRVDSRRCSGTPCRSWPSSRRRSSTSLPRPRPAEGSPSLASPPSRPTGWHRPARISEFFSSIA